MLGRDTILVKFVRGRKGDIVGVTNTGKIALISRRYVGPRPAIGEKWLARVLKEAEKYYIIEPLGKVKHAYLFRYRCGHEELAETTEPVQGELRVINGVPYIVKEINKPYVCPRCKEALERQLRNELRRIVATGVHGRGELNPDLGVVYVDLGGGKDLFIWKDRVELSENGVTVSVPVSVQRAVQLVEGLSNGRELLPSVEAMWGIGPRIPPLVEELLERIQNAKPVVLKYYHYISGRVKWWPEYGYPGKGIGGPRGEYIASTVILKRDLEELERKFRAVWICGPFEYRFVDTGEEKAYVLMPANINEAERLAEALVDVPLYYLKLSMGNPLDWNDVPPSEAVRIDLSRLKGRASCIVLVPKEYGIGKPIREALGVGL